MDKQKESVEVRGICAAIQSMTYPGFEELRKLLRKVGYDLIKLPKREAA